MSSIVEKKDYTWKSSYTFVLQSVGGGGAMGLCMGLISEFPTELLYIIQIHNKSSEQWNNGEYRSKYFLKKENEVFSIS